MEILQQISLVSSSTAWANLRLAQAAAYIQRFNVRVYHRAGRTNIIADALSRLPKLDNDAEEVPILDQLDTLMAEPVYNTVLVSVNEDFKNKIVQEYCTDLHYSETYKLLTKQAAADYKEAPNSTPRLPY